MTKILYIDRCMDCPYSDINSDDSEEITCICTHPFTKIHTKEYVQHIIPPKGIRKDCPLEEDWNEQT